ncbi:hypothetical protein BD777DRAFT_132707 [Yarrowia lipolytica]|nr:hypothetical protein BD777DRAFT_132707 [Yarrowia lipolytica]
MSDLWAEMAPQVGTNSREKVVGLNLHILVDRIDTVPESPSVLAPVLPALAPPCLSAGLSMSDNVSVRVSVPVSPRPGYVVDLVLVSLISSRSDNSPELVLNPPRFASSKPDYLPSMIRDCSSLPLSLSPITPWTLTITVPCLTSRLTVARFTADKVGLLGDTSSQTQRSAERSRDVLA